ncbi:hypothetical protein JKP88DRAFT_263376 [Tribonema minus]|uniref:Uncharacterized protein n=1 Tax=Tribonema minus TaxID=303371 RepID=A0A836CFM5_9STRA|nr:hypothetical protein JKP88DRAFT_263376 [Tribonema minus]
MEDGIDSSGAQLPGEEAAVIGRKSGVVTSKLTYTGLTDASNTWQPLLGSEQHARVSPRTCEFNATGELLAVSFDAGLVDIWTFATAPLCCRSLFVPDSMHDSSSAGSSPAGGKVVWCCCSMSWSYDSTRLAAAFNCRESSEPDIAQHHGTSSSREQAVNTPVLNGHVSSSSSSATAPVAPDGVESSDSDAEVHSPEGGGQGGAGAAEALVGSAGEENAAAAATMEVEHCAGEDAAPGSSATLNGAAGVMRADAHGDGDAPAAAAAAAAAMEVEFEHIGELVIATARGVLLLPAATLNEEEADHFGERRANGTRPGANYWWVGAAGDLRGRGDARRSAAAELSVLSNPSRQRYEEDSRNIFVWHVRRVDGKAKVEQQLLPCPNGDGLVSMTLARRHGQPILIVITGQGRVYARRELSASDFPGPMYPSGYTVVRNNIEYAEREDELDLVLSADAAGQTVHVRTREVVEPGPNEVWLDGDADDETDGSGVDIVGSSGGSGGGGTLLPSVAVEIASCDATAAVAAVDSSAAAAVAAAAAPPQRSAALLLLPPPPSLLARRGGGGGAARGRESNEQRHARRVAEMPAYREKLCATLRAKRDRALARARTNERKQAERAAAAAAAAEAEAAAEAAAAAAQQQLLAPPPPSLLRPLPATVAATISQELLAPPPPSLLLPLPPSLAAGGAQGSPLESPMDPPRPSLFGGAAIRSWGGDMSAGGGSTHALMGGYGSYERGDARSPSVSTSAMDVEEGGLSSRGNGGGSDNESMFAEGYDDAAAAAL